MLEKSMQPAFRIKCFDKIVRIISNPTSRRNVRYWHPLRPFPPNYYKDHQIFYPSLDTVLREKERIKKGKNFVDIGLPVPSVPGLSRHEKRMQQEIKQKKRQNLKEEELFEIIEQDEVKSEFDYSSNQNLWSKSESGINEIIQIANHYAIFEHLFNSNTPQPVDKVLEKKSIDFWPAIERELTWELEKYYPGAVRVDPPPEKEINFFHPIVPMRIEFAISENSESDELTVSPVYRGNHIKPTYSAVKPDVLIDASFLNGTKTKVPDDLIPNGIELFGENSKNLYTLALFNLDSQFGISDPVCHWMVSNIRSESGKTNYDEVFPFVPPYAFKGFGYHRYVFVLFKQESRRKFEKVDDFVMSKRIIDLKKLVSEEGSKPVGLSWFQSSWDEKCREIFHQILDMREPTYEYIQPKQTLAEQDLFPGRVPFNVYLDLYRDPKEIKKEVLLERLKDIDPFDYSKTLKESKIPWEITNDKHEYPKWYWTTLFKRSHKLGPYRALRNPSAILPLNNNADLDYPKWPFAEKFRLPLTYPYKGGRKKALKYTKWVLPLKDHPHIREYDEDINQTRRDEMKEDLETVKSIQSESHQKSDKTIS